VGLERSKKLGNMQAIELLEKIAAQPKKNSSRSSQPSLKNLSQTSTPITRTLETKKKNLQVPLL